MPQPLAKKFQMLQQPVLIKVVHCSTVKIIPFSIPVIKGATVNIQTLSPSAFIIVFILLLNLGQAYAIEGISVNANAKHCYQQLTVKHNKMNNLVDINQAQHLLGSLKGLST